MNKLLFLTAILVLSATKAQAGEITVRGDINEFIERAQYFVGGENGRETIKGIDKATGKTCTFQVDLSDKADAGVIVELSLRTGQQNISASLEVGYLLLGSERAIETVKVTGVSTQLTRQLVDGKNGQTLETVQVDVENSFFGAINQVTAIKNGVATVCEFF